MVSSTSNIAMPVPWNLLPATFVDRPNRFLTRIRVDDQVHPAHLPDPGRLAELLLPGVALRVQHHTMWETHRPVRKTAYTVHLVRRPDDGGWVSVNTLLPNRFVAFLLEERRLPFLANWSLAAREVTEGHSRFDFQLRRGADALFLEVKSVTFVEEGVAQFPDAVTVRGARHARHLAQLAREGQATMILFVIQRDDARSFRPMWQRDPKLGHALVEAHSAGVAIHAIKLAVSPESCTYLGEVSVDLSIPGGV